jgi:hypothetical protein
VEESVKKYDVYGTAHMPVIISIEANSEREALYEAAQRRASEWELTSTQVQPPIQIECAVKP